MARTLWSQRLSYFVICIVCYIMCADLSYNISYVMILCYDMIMIYYEITLRN